MIKLQLKTIIKNKSAMKSNLRLTAKYYKQSNNNVILITPIIYNTAKLFYHHII